jgi:dinuclear metal center YbgI/SA1388 family protein
MKLHALIRVMEEFAPLDFQEEYDNSGLLVGDPQMNIHGVMICLDFSLTVIAEAVSRQCNLVISHHPVMFRGIKKIIRGNKDSDIIREAIINNVALYAMHTNLDNSANGLNRLLSRRLGLENPAILLPRKNMLLKLATFCPIDHADKVRMAMFDAGAGQIGNYDWCSYNVEGKGTFRASGDARPFVGEPNSLHIENEIRVEVILPAYLETNIVKALKDAHPYEEVAYDIYPLRNHFPKAGSGMYGMLPARMAEEEFLWRVKTIVDLPVLRHSRFTGKPVQSVAICSGSGGFLINDVLRYKIDAFLTGDLRYHDFSTADGSLLLVDIGHFESECIIKELISELLIEKFPTFAVLISENEKNPVNYFKC